MTARVGGDVPARGETPRQALVACLLLGPATAHTLSALAGITEKDVAHHLEHIERTAKSKGQHFKIEPARCEECAFVFKKRERLGRPSRCPMCRSERILAPRFSLTP